MSCAKIGGIDGDVRAMRILREMGSKISISKDLLIFLWQRKMWWAMPMVAVLLLFGLLISFGSASGVGPFIYTLF
jgi:hypothetical protein